MNVISSIEENVTPQYVFGHNAMPLYLGKEDFIQEFLSSALKTVNKLWYITHKSLTGNSPPCHLKLVTTKLPNSMIAFVTKYPEPVNRLENLYSAVVVNSTSQIYYFTYELTKDFESMERAFILGSWSAPGSHLNFGHNKDTSIMGFLSAIQEVIDSAFPINAESYLSASHPSSWQSDTYCQSK